MQLNRKKRFWISGLIGSAAIGLVGGVFGAFLSASKPVLAHTHPPLPLPLAPEPVSTIKSGTPILLLHNGEARASVTVDRNGLMVLNFTTKTGHNQIALGVPDSSLLQIEVFDGAGKARGGLSVPMGQAAQVQTLRLDSAAPVFARYATPEV